MSVLQAEVYEAFRSIGAPDDEALNVDGAMLKWMVGFNLAMSVAVLFKVFSHRELIVSDIDPCHGGSSRRSKSRLQTSRCPARASEC